MTTSAGGEETVLNPDEAFAILGDQTRMEILRTLGQAEGPVSFSDLHAQVELKDSGQFNYHLDKLVGHFVGKSESGYTLRQAGRRVVEAVLSGAVTESPIIEPTPIDHACPVCGGSTVLGYYRDRVEHFCTECDGFYDATRAESDFVSGSEETADTEPSGYLGSAHLPPAGIQDRAPVELFHAAATWLIHDLIAIAGGACPRCSAALEETALVCPDHASGDGFCETCGQRHAVQIRSTCANCYYAFQGAYMLYLLNDPDLLAALIEHGVNPVAPRNPASYTKTLLDYEEELLATEPLEARFTLSIDGSAHALTVRSDLPVTEIGEA